MDKNFMIGMHGIFDKAKYQRDFRQDFYGIEACLLKETDIERLLDTALTEGIHIGIHFPLRAGQYKLRDPLFLSQDEQTRMNAYKDIENELLYIKEKQVNPEYILFHYPKPAVIPMDFDLTNWRFTDRSEYIYEEDYPMGFFRTQSEELFEWLSQKSLQYSFTPVLEFDTLNKYTYKDDFLEHLLERYPVIRICLDTGRIHMQNEVDQDFNGLELVKRFAKYTEVIHLWNVKVSTNKEYSHFPALPGLRPEEGWAPIDKYMEIIVKENKDVKIMFEHRSDLISNKELDSCYKWVGSIIEKSYLDQ